MIQAGLRYTCSSCGAIADVFVDGTNSPSLRDSLPEGWRAGRWINRSTNISVGCPVCAVDLIRAEEAHKAYRHKRKMAILEHMANDNSSDFYELSFPHDWIREYDKQNPAPDLWPQWAR